MKATIWGTMSGASRANHAAKIIIATIAKVVRSQKKDGGKTVLSLFPACGVPVTICGTL